MNPTRTSSPRVVLTHGGTQDGHEAITHETLARRLADLLDCAFGGDCEGAGVDPDSYLIPRASLSGPESAARYGIAGEHDLLGGWVPEPYMATKAILHPLVPAQAVAPPNWPAELASAAKRVTLPGFTAFSSADAIAAGPILLANGPVRLKPVHGTGGHGQLVAADAQELDVAVSQLSTFSAPEDGFVLERDLSDVTTYTVGQLRLPEFTISYCGTQSLTTDNSGQTAYGGSELIASTGGYENLPEYILPPEMYRAAGYAAQFDNIVDKHLPALIASRRNYDVASGRAGDGTQSMGIIDQSWRVGGATSAELLAVEVLSQNPEARAVRTRSVEIYGSEGKAPDGALVCFQGQDPTVGTLLKFAHVEEVIAR